MKAAGERITRPGGIEHLLERVGRNLERRGAVHEERAVLSCFKTVIFGPRCRIHWAAR